MKVTFTVALAPPSAPPFTFFASLLQPPTKIWKFLKIFLDIIVIRDTMKTTKEYMKGSEKMQATYKGKEVVYDIETNSYSDGFTTSFNREMETADYFYKQTKRDFITRHCEDVYKEHKADVRYYTDFVMQLNHRANYYYRKDEKLCELYCKLYEKYYDLGFKLFKGEDKDYYLGILD